MPVVTLDAADVKVRQLTRAHLALAEGGEQAVGTRERIDVSHGSPDTRRRPTLARTFPSRRVRRERSSTRLRQGGRILSYRALVGRTREVIARLVPPSPPIAAAVGWTSGR